MIKQQHALHASSSSSSTSPIHLRRDFPIEEEREAADLRRRRRSMSPTRTTARKAVRQWPDGCGRPAFPLSTPAGFGAAGEKKRSSPETEEGSDSGRSARRFSSARDFRSNIGWKLAPIAAPARIGVAGDDRDDRRSVKKIYSGDESRYRVQRALRQFRLVLKSLMEDGDSKHHRRYDLAAVAILKNNGLFAHRRKFVGSVPGVDVGDEFRYRVELAVVGLHGPYQGGIDSTIHNGFKVATNVVFSGGYPSDVGTVGSEVLFYTGSGGSPAKKKKKPAGDQKLELGNLALANSAAAGNPVRVIFRTREASARAMTFTYGGLYIVERYWQQQGSHGKLVYMFQLRRQAGQPETGKKKAARRLESSPAPETARFSGGLY